MMMMMMAPEDERQKTWDFDMETLDKAWLEYRSLPLADRQKLRFGQFFLNRFKIRSLISWPALFDEESAPLAYLMLVELAYSVNNKTPTRR